MNQPDGPRWLPWAVALVLAAIAATVAYNVGMSQGLAGQGGGAATVYRGHWFSPLWLLFGLFWFAAIFRGCWGGPRYWGYGRYYRGRGPWDDEVPPDFDEWHRRAHERTERTEATGPRGETK